MKNENRPNKLHYLLHSAALIDKCLSTHLFPLGLGPRQARVIDALDRMGPTSQINLARECDITAASMSTMTSRLMTAGYVSRETSPLEARRNTLSLTPLGQALLNDIKRIWTQVDQIIEKSIGTEKSDALATLARELSHALGGRAPGAKK